MLRRASTIHGECTQASNKSNYAATSMTTLCFLLTILRLDPLISRLSYSVRCCLSRMCHAFVLEIVLSFDNSPAAQEDRYTFISNFVPLSFDKQPVPDDVMRSFAAV